MPEKKKLIIDEDWKAQVEAEKQATQATSKQPNATAAGAAQDDQQADGPMPPASFDLLVTMLATEALVAMGHVPHPATGQIKPQRSQAKYLIDMIEMLHEKTTGNLTPDQTQLVEDVLHQLRLAFVDTAT